MIQQLQFGAGRASYRNRDGIVQRLVSAPAYLPVADGSRQHLLIIWLDDSTSMQTIEANCAELRRTLSD